MKTKKLLLAALFFLPLVSSAQPYNSANLKTGMEQHTIVRNWNNRYVVTHISDNNVSRFSCSNVSGFLTPYSPGGFTSNARYSDTLPHKYSVNDFRIVNELAFFCGAYKDSFNPNKYHGFVGYFNLTSFMSGLFQPVILELPDTKNLLRLAAFQVGSNYNAVAIGFDTFDTARFVEIKNIKSPSPVCALHKSGLPLDERFDDVFFARNKIVLIGTVFSGSATHLAIKVLDNPADLATSSRYSDVIVFLSAPDEINARTRSTLLDDNKIAVAYVKAETSPQTFYKRLRVIDTSPADPINTHSQQFVILEKMETSEMTFSPTAKKLVLLQEPYTYAYNSNFYFLEPFTTTSYTANITNFLHNKPYCSIDTYNADNVIAVGMEYGYMQFVFNQTNLGCPHLSTTDVKTIANLNITPPNDRTVNLSIPYNLRNLNLLSYPTNWGTDCCTH